VVANQRHLWRKAGLLCHRDRPTPIPATFIDSPHRAADDGSIVAMLEPSLRPGKKVQLWAGPAVDDLGALLYLAPKDRARLLLSVLAQDVSTTVSRRMVAPAA
jgi:hypothetical protein